MWDRIVGIANALGVERPGFVLGLGKITHCSVPESPPGFYLAVGLGVMAAGRSAAGACDVGDGRHKFAEEFRRIVGVKDIGGAAAKVEFIEEARYEGGGLAVGQGDEDHGFRETIDQGQGFGFASFCEALALKIHSVAGAGFVRGVGGEETMRKSSFTLFVLTHFAIFTDSTYIIFHGWPKVVAG